MATTIEHFTSVNYRSLKILDSSRFLDSSSDTLRSVSSEDAFTLLKKVKNNNFSTRKLSFYYKYSNEMEDYDKPITKT